MSRKCLLAAILLCIIAVPAFAAPSLRITGGINNANASPVRVWNVAAGPDIALDPSTALALELGFQATGGNILSITPAPNMAAAAAPAPARVQFDTNPGNVIFGWETLTDVDPTAGVNMQPVGVQLGTGANANKAVAFIGSNLFTTAGNRDLLTITTQSSVTSLVWGGRYDAAGALVTLTGNLPGRGRIAQGDGTPVGGTNFQEASYAGSLAALGPLNLRFLGDMDGNGTINSFDINPFAQALSTPNTYKTNRPNLNILRADFDGNGIVNSFDIAGFRGCTMGLCINNAIGSGQSAASSWSGDGGAAAGLELASVPEPASWLLAAFLFTFAAALRRRHQ